MFKNYLKTAVRSLLNNKLFSLINVFGLAIGIACAVLIGLYVRDELSFDRFHPDHERIYRISRDYYETEISAELLLATIAPQAAGALAADFPEIETAVRLFGGSRALLSREDITYYEDSLVFADETLFEIFSFEWKAGDPDTALVAPLSIVMTESAARKYFGDADPLGETLLLENSAPLQVTGVIGDLPHNTHLRADVFVPMKAIEPILGESYMNNWDSSAFHTYVKLAPGADIDVMTRQFPDFLERRVAEGASGWSAMSAMNLADIHLRTNKQVELTPPGNLGAVYTFAAVAFCVLIIACFNFMNLSTARSSRRMKEVGVRKYAGARKEQLIGQFIGESVVLAVLATVVALVLVELLLPVFNQFVGKPLQFNLASDLQLQLATLGLVLFVGFFAGSYPAFYLSAFNPADVFRGTLGAGIKDALLFRNCLVILQFSVSIALLVATAVVLLQMNFARNIELGFRKDQIVTLSGSPTRGLGSQWEAMRDELLRHPEITHVTGSNILPFEENMTSYATLKEGSPEEHYMPAMLVNHDFFETYDIDLLSGRSFSKDFPADQWDVPVNVEALTTANFILNESAAREHDWSPDEAAGSALEVIEDGTRINGRIVGVVSDSYFESVRFTVKPMLFILAPSTSWGAFPTLSYASIRITGSDVQGTLDHIDRTWQSFEPDVPVIRGFLNEDFTSVYLEEDRQGEMLIYFATLAILIACLGLFGLASFNTQRRMKEIGIRKVMGGTVWSIVLLLTNDFSKLVLVANLIAWPVAYFAMNRWLENFAYRMDLTPLIFIGSGFIALCIAWVTVGGTAAKAASAKPVLALRYE